MADPQQPTKPTPEQERQQRLEAGGAHLHRFVQYNILSQSLAYPAHYSSSPKAALNAETRKAKIFEKLERFARFVRVTVPLASPVQGVPQRSPEVFLR